MRDAYHVRAFSTKVKNEWNYTSIFSVFVACTGGKIYPYQIEDCEMSLICFALREVC